MTRNLILSLALVSLLLTSCGLSETDVQSTVGAAVTNAVGTVNAQYTEIALLTPSATNTPLTTSTPMATNTPAGTPTTGAISGGSTSGCDVGSFVADVTVSDGDEIEAGTPFTKTWSVKNDGTCEWTTSYMLIFSSGDQMGGPTSTPLTAAVPVGSTTNISVSLTAPASPGSYTGYWAIANASGIGFTYLSVVITVP
ncbi:MAG TPA: NBR1-Ig-like domain-containing protein [Anaerolineales bacterium]|nr:NBR1-Ig-like domain-containing protein [Anaerolineales bacterium]